MQELNKSSGYGKDARGGRGRSRRPRGAKTDDANYSNAKTLYEHLWGKRYTARVAKVQALPKPEFGKLVRTYYVPIVEYSYEQLLAIMEGRGYSRSYCYIPGASLPELAGGRQYQKNNESRMYIKPSKEVLIVANSTHHRLNLVTLSPCPLNFHLFEMHPSWPMGGRWTRSSGIC